MLLQVENTETNETSIIEVMNVDYEKDASRFSIFDFCDNLATITTKDAYSAERTVRGLFSSGRATVEGTISWDT